MKKQSIRSHLKPYSIFQKRQTTINHAFASAIAPNDEYQDKIIDEALKVLEQNPEEDLFCVYCDESAETWDHLFGLVKNSEFSGYGHIIGNLLPCCKKCNSEKGNMDWIDFLNKKISNDSLRKEKMAKIQRYLDKYIPIKLNYAEIKKICANETREYDQIKNQIFDLMKRADVLAQTIRTKIEKAQNNTK